MKAKFFLVVFLYFISMNLSSQEKQKIIFDCDLGGDIDDAFAVALILASPEIEVLGFVMDQGDTPKRAQVACKMLYETGMEDITGEVVENEATLSPKNIRLAIGTLILVAIVVGVYSLFEKLKNHDEE